MKNTTINFIKRILEEQLDLVTTNPEKKFKKEYVEQLFVAYKDFISTFGDGIDVEILNHYTEILSNFKK